MPALLLSGGRPWGLADAADVLVREGKIDRIGAAIEAPDADVIDVSGRLLLPGLIDAHTHLDKTLCGGPWVPHSAGDALAARIANERRRRFELGLPSADYATALLERMVVAGTSRVRSHTDIDPEVGLRGVEAIRAAASRLDGRITVEQVAFPQSGLLTNPGTAELLEEALRSGVETVGGLDPAGVDKDPVRPPRRALRPRRAVRRGDRHPPARRRHARVVGAGPDRRSDEGLRARGPRDGEPRLRVRPGLVAAEQDRLIEQLAEAGVTVLTAAVYSFPVPPIKRLRAAGVNVACGHDGIRDLWGPYGSGDMLERAMHVAYRSGFRRDEDIEVALDAATYGGARTLGLQAYGLAEGAPADIVVVDARTPAEAVVARPVRELVLKAGRVVARHGALV